MPPFIKHSPHKFSLTTEDITLSFLLLEPTDILLSCTVVKVEYSPTKDNVNMPTVIFYRTEEEDKTNHKLDCLMTVENEEDMSAFMAGLVISRAFR